MDIKQLKDFILNNKVSDDILIFKYTDSKYLCDEYVNAIASLKNLTKLNINSLDELASDDNFFEEISSPYLYIYDVDELSDIDPKLKNLIVLCKKVNINVSVDYIEFPHVQNWQIEDLMKVTLPGLDEDKVKWVCEICKYDYYRLMNESKKISIFNKETQPIIFDEMNIDDAFSDLNNLTIMNLTNAIMQKDLITINSILSNLKNIDIEGTGLCTLLLRQFKSNIEVAFNNSWNSQMTCSEKQFKYLKWNPNKNYSASQLLNIYEFLTGLDMRLKKGYFTFNYDNRSNNEAYVSYIVVNILSLSQ